MGSKDESWMIERDLSDVGNGIYVVSAGVNGVHVNGL